jgi:hypothetical protein
LLPGREAAALGALTGLLLACATPQATPPPTEAYLAALQRGEVDQAWSLTSARFRAGTSLEAYRSRFSDPSVREAHVLAVRQALAQQAPELLDQPPRSPQPAEAVRALARAARAGQFREAWQWLAAPERLRATAEELERDFHEVPDVQARLSRALAAVEAPGESSGGETRWTLPSGGAVRVVEENGQPRVLALE